MEIKEGDILVKNDIQNSFTRRYNMVAGDKFRVIRYDMNDQYEEIIKVVNLKYPDRNHVMYIMHFLDSDNNLIPDCIWRQT